jgi:hypothetical protein
MAAKKYDWGDGKGKVHTISLAQHKKNVEAIKPVPHPELDQQTAASKRGLDDLLADIGLGRERSVTDLGLGQYEINRQKGLNAADYNTGVADVNTQAGRSLADLLTARKQAGEDYGTTIAGVQRGYQQLGERQGEMSRKSGIMAGGGAYAQSARKRAANEALDRAPIDTAYSRFNEQSGLSETRLGEDKARSLASLLTSLGRANDSLDIGGGQQALAFKRQDEDWGTTEDRARREYENFRLDTAAALQARDQTPVLTTNPLTPPKKKKPKVVTYRNDYPRTA